MSMFSVPSPLLPLLDSDIVSGMSIRGYRSFMELVYGKLEKDSENSLLLIELVCLEQPHHVSKHKYVVVTVQGPDNTLRYFAFDRFGGGVTSTNQASVSRGMITILPAQGREGDRILARLPCQDFELFLYQLVVLADVVHQQVPYYELLNTECYWFVGMIVDTIRTALETSETRGTKILPKPFITILDRSPKAGYWGFVKIRGELPEQVIEETKYDWQKAVDVFANTIEKYRLPNEALGAEIRRGNGGGVRAVIRKLFR